MDLKFLVVVIKIMFEAISEGETKRKEKSIIKNLFFFVNSFQGSNSGVKSKFVAY